MDGGAHAFDGGRGAACVGISCHSGGFCPIGFGGTVGLLLGDGSSQPHSPSPGTDDLDVDMSAEELLDCFRHRDGRLGEAQTLGGPHDPVDPRLRFGVVRTLLKPII